MTNIKHAYFAGLIDGEGCISLQKRSDHHGYRPTVEVKMSCLNTILALKEEYGGTFLNKPAEREGWKDQYRWRVQDRSARLVIDKIYPYLITKKADAGVLLNYWERRGSK